MVYWDTVTLGFYLFIQILSVNTLSFFHDIKDILFVVETESKYLHIFQPLKLANSTLKRK